MEDQPEDVAEPDEGDQDDGDHDDDEDEAGIGNREIGGGGGRRTDGWAEGRTRPALDPSESPSDISRSLTTFAGRTTKLRRRISEPRGKRLKSWCEVNMPIRVVSIKHQVNRSPTSTFDRGDTREHLG